ncbi:MAG: gliding motility-associated C-terminal domain-containing protein [Bacteroidales bacterium]|nr:MAG: gliding motility-associated C-terminal domain-containing protein [Bacteroidales bacterium]
MPKVNIHPILILIIICNLTVNIFCQVTEKPNPPGVYFVSVEPETGDVKIVWIPSTSANVHLYIILKAELTGGPNYPPAYIEIGRVPSTDSVFIYEDSESLLHSDGYTVASVDTVSDLSDFNQLVDSTLFISSEFDSCKSEITLNWNDYNRWRGNIREYNLYRKINNDVTLIQTLPEGTNSYIIENVQANIDYGFYLEAVHNDEIRKSTSNMTLINTHMSKPPEYINADYASISAGNYVELSFTVDTASELTYYKLYRSNSAGGPFNVIDSFNRPDKKFIHIDDIEFTSGIYYYKIESYNNCNQAVISSNISNNILLSGSNYNLINTLEWNGITNWAGNVLKYELIRTAGAAIDIIDTVYKGSLLFYEDDLGSLASTEDPVINYYCYKIKASETNNPYNINNTCFSNEVCLTISTEIRMPNAFIPNDDINNKFGPVFNFRSSDYKLTIYNRLGFKVWEGNEPWDGNINEARAPKGFYLYHIKVYKINEDPVEKKGYVFLFYR